MQEIGITSDDRGLEVLDTFGLADSQIAKAQGPPSGKAAPDYVFGRAPDFSSSGSPPTDWLGAARGP